MRVVIAFLSLSLLIAACGDDSALDAADDGTIVVTSPGNVITLELESNPSTGYSWVLSGEPGIVTPIDESWSGDDAIVGSPGITRFEFEVMTTGTTELVLEYRRPWENGVEPERTFTVTIESR